MLPLAVTENWKIQTLPLARIKKIMKSEEFILQELEREKIQQVGSSSGDKPQVKFMISGEAPLLMSKACELFVKELSTRAWLHTERNRRRTLQRQDVHAAVGESEVFDFLIDLVPRVSSQSSRHGLPASLPDTSTIPGIPSIPMQIPNVSGSLVHPVASEFGPLTDPMHGHFPFYAMPMAGLDTPDGSSLHQQGPTLNMFSGQQVQQQQRIQQPPSLPHTGQNHPQPYIQDVQPNQNQLDQHHPHQWTDPPL